MSNLDKKFNYVFDIPLEELEDRVGIKMSRSIQGYSRVIPLRDMSKINHVVQFKEDRLYTMIKKIPLRGTNIFPYEDSKIWIFNRDPEGMEVGQTFVLESKILSIMNAFRRGNLFKGFVSNGLSNMLPLEVYGRDNEGEKARAFYISSMMEIHDDNAILLDGIHRSTICSSGGTSNKFIHIQNVGAKLPFDPINWEDVSFVDEKPPVDERYVNLKPELYRDLSYVGIDG